MSTTNPDCPIELGSLSLVKFLLGMPPEKVADFCQAIQECSDQLRADVLAMIAIAEDEKCPQTERQRALMTIADALHLNPDEDGRYGLDLNASETGAAARFPALATQVELMDTQEAQFADRLRQLLKDKCITQKQLAEQIECTQPAISQMLNRKCRPQRKTLDKIAKALNVDVRELWPDLEVSEYLDAVAEFGRDDYVMTEAEAAALRDTDRPESEIKGKVLPSWREANSTGE